jgi:DNA-binding MarR family transcriptional regulator
MACPGSVYNVASCISMDGNMKRKNNEVAVGRHTEELAESWRRERPDLDLEDFLLGIYLMRIGRLLDDAYDRMCREIFGVSGADMRVLFALRRAGPPYARRPTDLFRALLVTSGAMTKQVDRLSGLQFVERRRDPRQATGLLIQLTKLGLRVANQASESLAKHSLIAPATASMSASDRASGERFCQQLLAALDATEVPISSLSERVDESAKAWDLPRKVSRKRSRSTRGSDVA